jgi:hypothetical protein
MGSNQSAWIVGYIILAFIIYITLKGELPVYAGLLLLSPQAAQGSASQQAASSNAAIVKAAVTYAPYVLGG